MVSGGILRLGGWLMDAYYIIKHEWTHNKIKDGQVWTKDKTEPGTKGD